MTRQDDNKRDEQRAQRAAHDIANGQPISRTPEDKARAVIANLEQLIVFEENKLLTGHETVAAYKEAIASIKSEFSLS